jgi:hypothetical protein
MALNIKNEEVVALVRQLAARRGTDMTEAIRTAVEHELEADEEVVQQRLRAIRKIQDRVAAMPRRDPRSSKEIRDEINEEIFE